MSHKTQTSQQLGDATELYTKHALYVTAGNWEHRSTPHSAHTSNKTRHVEYTHIHIKVTLERRCVSHKHTSQLFGYTKEYIQLYG